MVNSPNKIKVMLVDDSAVVRGFLSRILDEAEDTEVVASVVNGQQAVDMVNRYNPDIIILDIEMPVMDGITAVPKILEKKPDAKILMCSTLSTKNADISMKAMSLGAIDCIGKPTTAINIKNDSEFKESFLYKIRNIASPHGRGASALAQPSERSGFVVKPKQQSSSQAAPATSPVSATSPVKFGTTKDVKLVSKASLSTMPPKVLAIGSSTGGPQALFTFISALKSPNVPIVITQHMPATFTKILASHIQQHTSIPTVEGEDGMKLEAGKAYVAPGGKHMLFEKGVNGTYIKIDDGPPENFCKPAVDPMIRSLMDIYGTAFITVILTGMGSDGLRSCQSFVEKGGRVIAQDEASSVVWGMPGAVATAGICMEVLPLNEIGSYVSRMIF
ncbi:MAG: chemotaxis response regulator protein-glutamate methylesterase [Pseudomonadota bacterium]|nr:chemotaxis response regulator protein-glutamate methylesterase [Alphaproteobacteria bacterium]MEC9235115.1 chemotaxis response regulator protein-glutamate methylesterase [Pseudomonadota bacterium]